MHRSDACPQCVRYGASASCGICHTPVPHRWSSRSERVASQQPRKPASGSGRRVSFQVHARSRPETMAALIFTPARYGSIVTTTEWPGIYDILVIELSMENKYVIPAVPPGVRPSDPYGD